MRKLLFVSIWLVICGMLGYNLPMLPIVKDYVSIKEVRVKGTDKLKEEDLRDILKTENWFFISEDRIKEKMSKFPFIGSIKLERPAFGVVDMIIQERKPYGLVRVDNDVYVIDEEGNLIKDLSYFSEEELSNLRYIISDGANLNADTLANIKKIENSLKTLKFKEFIIHNSIITTITEDDRVIILSKENIEDSLNKLNIFARNQKIEDFSYLNFSFDRMVIVKR